MAISPIASPLSSPISAASAVGTQNALLHNAIGDRVIKDQIDLSKEAVTLLVGGGAPLAK